MGFATLRALVIKFCRWPRLGLRIDVGTPFCAQLDARGRANTRNSKQTKTLHFIVQGSCPDRTGVA